MCHVDIDILCYIGVISIEMFLNVEIILKCQNISVERHFWISIRKLHAV